MSHLFLQGVKVLELAGLAPVPFCGMLLADFGASVDLIINKSSKSLLSGIERRMDRGKRKIELDLALDGDRQMLRNLCRHADVLLDPFRPGTIEALGLDPEELRKHNPGLIVARVTGYGQTGPMSTRAGHDINFVALSGLPSFPKVDSFSRPSADHLWQIPGRISSVASRQSSGRLCWRRTARRFWHFGGAVETHSECGCVLDCSMTEGLAYLGSFVYLYRDQPMLWDAEFAVFGGKCPIYRTYQTADGKWVAVGALERKFQRNLFKTLKLDEALFEDFGQLAAEMERIFATKTREQWTRIFKDADACVTPVLDLDEAAQFHLARASGSERSPNARIPGRAPRVVAEGQGRSKI